VPVATRNVAATLWNPGVIRPGKVVAAVIRIGALAAAADFDFHVDRDHTGDRTAAAVRHVGKTTTGPDLH